MSNAKKGCWAVHCLVICNDEARILADFAFASSAVCVSAFKKLCGSWSLLEDEVELNRLIARTRDYVEYCIESFSMLGKHKNYN